MFTKRHGYLELIGALFTIALAACATKTQSPMAGTNVQTSAPPASEIVSPRENRWNYRIDPVPAPSRKPEYRLNEITFTEGTTSFGREGGSVCRDTAAKLKSLGVSRVLLVGYTHQGEAGTLGLDRTKKVRDCLVDHGLSPDVFEMSSFGSTFSKADATEPMLMEQERRVEIWVVATS